MFLGISLRVPFILVITLQDRKPLFCVFFSFRDLYGLKLTGDFSRIIIFQNMTVQSFEITQTESRRRKEDRWRAHHLGAPPMLFSPSEHPSRPVKAPEGSLDLKTPYIKVSDASREEAARRSRNTEILSEPATIGGELSSIAAQGEISTPPRLRTSSP